MANSPLPRSLDVLLINSPLFREVNPLYDEDSLPPLGLGYIASALENAGMSVMLIDAVADRVGLADLVERARALRPRAIGINVFTTNYLLVREFVESLSGTCPHVMVGSLATRTLYPEIFRWQFDGQLDVVAGDGERIAAPLLSGAVDEKPRDTDARRRFFQVDSRSKYYVNDISSLPLNRRFFANEPVQHPLGFVEANIVASRGCIYNCAFCAAASSSNKNMGTRERSVESLQAELADIRAQFSAVTSIRVLDDLFLKTAKCITRAIDVFQGQGYRWRAMAHVMTFQGATASNIARSSASSRAPSASSGGSARRTTSAVSTATLSVPWPPGSRSRATSSTASPTRRSRTWKRRTSWRSRSSAPQCDMASGSGRACSSSARTTAPNSTST